METVSESFKKAIKATEREVKGYVEVIFDNQDGSGYQLMTAPERLRNSLDTEILDGIKKNKKYASLEENYTELDGSFLLPNYNVKGDKSGYVSNEIFSNIENRTITLSKESNFITSSGITIYFENNIAQKFTLTIINGDDENVILEVENDKSVYQHIFDNPMIIKSISINIQQMEYSNRRIRISEIDFGISQVYEGSDLVSFTTNEEIDLLFTSTPINTCTVNLNNYDSSFNPLNPTGLVKYLTDNCIIKPYIGVLTEENGIEYVPMGYFYLKDWSSDNDGNVTLNGQSLMGILSNLTIKSDGQFLYNNGQVWTGETLGNYLSKMYGYIFKLKNFGATNNTQLKETNLLKYLKALFAFMATINYPRRFYISRANEAILDLIDDNVVDYIERIQLTEDAKYESKSIINKVNIVDIDNYSITSSDKSDLLNQTYTLTNTEEYVWLTFNKSTNNNRENKEFSYTSTGNGKAELIDYNKWLAYIKFTGNIGDSITVHLNGFKFEDPPTLNVTYQNNYKVGDTLSLDYTNYFDAGNEFLKDNAEYYLTRDKKYKVTGNYVGDPSLTAGDTISVETKFGNKDVVLTKSSLTFDGGLSGSFEGMGD
ncbi:MAG: hypothetical protein Q4E39_05275 [bacterium]|nr:hypothetical protein [bacterium]